MTSLLAACCLAAAAGEPDRAYEDYRAEQAAGPHQEWKSGGALDLLETLRGHPRHVYLMNHEEQQGFVRESELEALMERLASSEPCAVVLQVISAHLPRQRSTVGHEAALLIEGFRIGHYPRHAASNLHSVDVEELRQWWHVWQRLRPARAWSSGQHALEPDVAYVANFRLDTGWQPVETLPMPRHHAARIELANLDDFGHLRFGIWKEARITFRLLKSEVQPIDPPRRWNTIYTAEILRVE